MEQELQNTVGNKMRLIHNQIKKVMKPKYQANVGTLTAMQRWVLEFLEAHAGEDVYQRDIETAFFISRATASNMLKALERRGMIARVPVAHDARLKKVILTENARALKRQIREDVREMERQLLGGFTEEELATLHRYLDRMLSNLS